ncbi:MAG: hypothetical protein BWY73_00678 [candidate division TA06 bacterium ADurb.Bin417]|uniref:Uncharacterized protein n=1 Tax=candidate division TA06 bacterium ADurb.Bin417 TaxID=1852828 RepID=A0A1V5MHJ8_UNCT6|nr:MAG: hypothetical protein BWY73_00678 [candidate division TA06 bacterium ADurb.Bin417]
MMGSVAAGRLPAGQFRPLVPVILVEDRPVVRLGVGRNPAGMQLDAEGPLADRPVVHQEADRAAFELQQGIEGIFVVGAAFPDVAHHPAHLPAHPAQDVDRVDDVAGEHVDPAVVIRPGAQPVLQVAGAALDDRTPFLDPTPGLDQERAETALETDHAQPVPEAGPIGHPAGFGRRHAGRLLDENVEPAVEAFQDRLQDQEGRQDKIDRRRLDLVQHPPVIGEGPLNTETIRRGPQTLRFEVAEAGQFHVRKLGQGWIMHGVGDLPGADQRQAYPVTHASPRLRPKGRFRPAIGRDDSRP